MFPQCALGAASQKYTTLLVSAGLSPALQSLSNLRCQHFTHAGLAGGSKTADGWSSRLHSAYPPDLNFLFARVIASHLPLDTPLTQTADQPPETRQLPKTTPTVPPTTATAATPPNPPPDPPVNRPLPVADNSERQTEDSQRHFTRTLGPYPLRSRGGALLATRARCGKPKWGRNTRCAFAA
eukprot:1217682-Pleurochrysis_carterae.AAC.1